MKIKNDTAVCTCIILQKIKITAEAVYVIRESGMKLILIVCNQAEMIYTASRDYIRLRRLHTKPFGLNKNDLIRMVRIRSFLVEISGDLRARRKVSQPCVNKDFQLFSPVQACSREPLRIQRFSILDTKTKNTPRRRVFVLVEISGFEPLASSLRTRRSTN